MIHPWLGFLWLFMQHNTLFAFHVWIYADLGYNINSESIANSLRDAIINWISNIITWDLWMNGPFWSSLESAVSRLKTWEHWVMLWTCPHSVPFSPRVWFIYSSVKGTCSLWWVTNKLRFSFSCQLCFSSSLFIHGGPHNNFLLCSIVEHCRTGSFWFLLISCHSS